MEEKSSQLSFGDMIKMARFKKKLSLRGAALEIGISAAYLSLLEHNTDGHIPSDKVIKSISDVLAVSYKALREASTFISPDLKSMQQKLSQSDAANLQAFYRVAQTNNISTKEALSLFVKAVNDRKRA